MNNATIHDHLYVLALVYTNDIERLNILIESGIVRIDFDLIYRIPIPNNCRNVMDMINDLLLINGFFTDLNDFMYKNRLFQILFAQNKIDRLKPHPKIEAMYNDNYDNDSSEADFNPAQETSSSDNNVYNDLSIEEEIDKQYFEMTLLKVAVLMEYEEMVKCLIKFGTSVELPEKTDIDSIHLAMYQNNLIVLKILLPELSENYVKKKSINKLVDQNGLNPLHLAVYNQCIESIQLLYNHGADINDYEDTAVKWPLIWAMETFDISEKTIECLLELDCDPNLIDEASSISPLIVAIVSDRFDLVKLLINYGANVNQKFADSYINPLKIAIDYFRENSNGEEIFRALLDYGANINFYLPEILLNSDYSMPYFESTNQPTAQEEEEFDTIMNRVQLLNQTNELNLNRSYRRYPLIFSIYLGCKDLVKILLEYGAYQHTITFDYYSPISSACYVGNKDIVELLIRYGVDPTLNCYQSNTPLTISIARNDTKLTELLLSYYKTTYNLDKQDSNGDFALLYASYNKKAHLVQKLLELGANPDLTNNHNVNALWYSIFNNDKSTFFELIKYVKDLDTKSYGIDYQNFDSSPQIIYETPISAIIVAEKNSFYDMVYYLHCIGAHVSIELRKRIQTKIFSLIVETNVNKIASKDFKKLRNLITLLNSPLTLQRLCRKFIRDSNEFDSNFCEKNGLCPCSVREFLSLENFSG